MGIRREQPGASKAAATAGVAIGQAKRAEEDRARAEREQVRADQEAAARTARQTAMKWELQKAQITSQRAFEQELRQEDYKLAAEDRAHEWQIEKAELASRMDFEQEEKERLLETGRVDSKITALKKAQEDGLFTGKEFEFEDMMTKLQAEKYGIKGGIKTLDPQQRMLYNMQRQAEADASGGMAAPGVGFPAPSGEPTVQNMEAIAAVGKTYLRRKDTGELVEIPVSRAKEAVATGRFTFPSVSSGLEAGTTGARVKDRGLFGSPAHVAGQGKVAGQIGSAVAKPIKEFLARRFVVAVVSPEGKKEEIHIRDLADYKKRGYIQDPTHTRQNVFNF